LHHLAIDRQTDNDEQMTTTSKMDKFQLLWSFVIFLKFWYHHLSFFVTKHHYPVISFLPYLIKMHHINYNNNSTNNYDSHV